MKCVALPVVFAALCYAIAPCAEASEPSSPTENVFRGALWIGEADEMVEAWRQEDAKQVIGITGTEGHRFARAKDAAAMIKITSKDVLSMHVTNGVITEPQGGAQTDIATTAAAIKQRIKSDLEKLMKKNPEVLVKYRNKKIQEMGVFSELSK